MNADKPRSLCLYCGQEALKVRKGEHIIPEAIGGRITISQECKGRKVCHHCNNQVLSSLDTELCSRSVMSIVAGQELGKLMEQTWDVDEEANNLLMEARPDFNGSSMIVYPQMIFETTGPEIRGDLEEQEAVGFAKFAEVFIRSMLSTYRDPKRDAKHLLHLRRIPPNPHFFAKYRHPPRVFARKPITEFKEGMSFHLHFLDSADQTFVFDQLESWDITKSFQQRAVALGSGEPPSRSYANNRKVLRALLKIGFNLVAAYCRTTAVTHREFGEVVSHILGKTELTADHFDRSGFVHPSGIEAIAVPAAHSFRLLHADEEWQIYISFFGGRMGAVVRFHGPNSETWRCLDVTMPLSAEAVKTNVRTILHPLGVVVEWKDMAKVIPWAGFKNTRTDLV